MKPKDKRQGLNTWGIQTELARAVGMSRSTLNYIFSGKKRATPEQAAALEAEFVRRGIDINRWDLIYGLPEDGSVTLEDILSRKGGK